MAGTDYAALIARRLAELAAEDAAAAADRATVELDQQSVGRLSRMDALQRQAMAQATHRRRAQERTALMAAQTRLESGDFGWCAECGDAIEPARLRVNPALVRCLECARGV
ncbi:MAG: TraR/DksA C4-type zinc finger protein [Pseudomonadota bacterium]